MSTSSSSSITRTTSTSDAPSPSPTPSASNQSVKIGAGIGAPLGASATAIIGYLFYRFNKNRRSSRERHVGNIAAAGLYPVVDDADSGEKGIFDAGVLQTRNEMTRAPASQLHGDHVPLYSIELVGSPGLERKELG